MSESTATYLYAIVPQEGVPRGLGRIGLEGGQVQSIVQGKLAAVVSEFAKRDKLRPERTLLSAHRRVIEEVSRTSPAVLPVSFGTYAEEEHDVEELMKRYQDDLASQIEKVRGKMEMRVRLEYTATNPDVFGFLLSNSQTLRDARDALVAAGPKATRDMKINVGQAADNVLAELRDQYAKKIEDTVGNLASDKVRKPPRNETDFAEVAFLIGHGAQQAFDNAVDRMSGLFPDYFVLSPSGPNAPYDFVNMHIQALQGHS